MHMHWCKVLPPPPSLYKTEPPAPYLTPFPTESPDTPSPIPLATHPDSPLSVLITILPDSPHLVTFVSQWATITITKWRAEINFRGHIHSVAKSSIPPCWHARLPHHSTKHRPTHKSQFAQAKPMSTNNPMLGYTIPAPQQSYAMLIKMLL